MKEKFSSIARKILIQMIYGDKGNRNDCAEEILIMDHTLFCKDDRIN